MRTGWSSLYLSKINNIYYTVFVRFHWWFQIWNLIVNLVNSFGEFDVSPYKMIGASLGCPREVSKDGGRVTWLVLKRLWGKAQFIACHHNHTVYDHNNNVCQESTLSLYFISYLYLFKLLLLNKNNPTAVLLILLGMHNKNMKHDFWK